MIKLLNDCVGANIVVRGVGENSYHVDGIIGDTELEYHLSSKHKTLEVLNGIECDYGTYSLFDESGTLYK